MLLIGVSGSGRSTLARFVAWMNGYAVVQLNVHRKYSASDFDDDLRALLIRCGAKREKICYIIDDGSILQSAFLERINTLLANSEVPGLFAGDELNALLVQCKDNARDNVSAMDSEADLLRWFTSNIRNNLHVVFTMNPPANTSARAATSPALFNRCVLDWCGDWSDLTLAQVANSMTRTLDLERTDYNSPSQLRILTGISMPLNHRAAIVNALCYVHRSVEAVDRRRALAGAERRQSTPRQYLDLLSHFSSLYTTKSAELEEQQRHFNTGLDKLQETFEQVETLRGTLAHSEQELQVKVVLANEKLEVVYIVKFIARILNYNFSLKKSGHGAAAEGGRGAQTRITCHFKGVGHSKCRHKATAGRGDAGLGTG